MADLIELDLVVRDKGLKASISTVERLERQIIKAAKAVDQNSISQVRYNKILLSTKREYEALGLSSQKSTSTVRAFAAAQRKATAEAAKENSALKKLKSSYDSVYAAEQKRLRLKKLLRAEVAAGNMTLREAGRELLLYRQRLHETSQGFQFAKNRANKFGMVAQQVGYQVGDFFVQVQSGTSALVAFGQQGTQLAGLLPGIYGAVVGIGLSLGTMILRTFLDTRDAGKQLEESVKAVGEALDDLSSTTSMLESTLGAPISAATERLQNYLLLLKKAKSQETFKEVSISFNQLLKEIGTGAEKLEEGSFMQKFILGTKFGPSKEDLSNAEYLLKVQGELAEVIKGTTQQPRIVETSADIAALGDDLLAFSEKHGDVMKKRIEGVLLETGLVQLMADELSTLADDQAKAGDEHDAQVKATNANLDAQLALQMKQYTEQQKIDALRDKENFRLDQEITHAKYLNKFQMDKKEIAISLADIARINYELSLKEKQFTATEIVDLMEKYDLLQAEKAENDRILELQKEKLKAQKELNREVEKLAERLSIPFERALELIRQAKEEATVGLDAFGGPGSFKYGGIQTYTPESLKGAKPTTMEGPIKALERQIELSKALFGLQGAARREEEIYMQLKFKNQDADIKAGKEELELLAERVALEEQRTEAEQMNLKNISPLKKYVAEYAKLVKLKDSGLGDEAFAKEVAKLNEELAKSNPLLNSFTDAFADFLGRGARDFKSFAKDILNDFKSMLIQMITTAARNKIMFSMGMGGGALGTAAAAGGGGSFASQAGGSIIGSVAKSAFGSIIQGGFTGASSFGAGLSTSLGLGTSINGAVSMALSPTMASVGSAVGALAGPLLAVGALFSFLRSKTKELDSGLRVTVDNMDVLVKTFRTIQKSRFWGLSKKVRTTEEEASSEVSDPIVDAVATIQESVMEAASAFGVASDKFDDFTYDFEVSLKGLTEDQKVEKLNEEFTKLGDSFTEMSGLFSNMNDLMAVYQQRLDLENQLLVAQGEVVKLREQELETINVLNRDLATRIHLLQAEGDTQSALTAFASGISEQQGLIRRAVDALVKPLQDAIDRTRTQAEKSYNIFKAAADKSVDSAKNIVDIITSALDSRTIISESAELMRYQTAQKQLASFAGGASFDEASLRRATEGVSIDSQKFFGSFEDYARDFYRTQINLEDLADVAEKELSEVEQQIDIAQKAYEVAMGTHQEVVDLNAAIETLAQDLNIYEATKLANEPLIKMVQDEGNRQIELLDSILVETTKQVNTQLGIESSMADLVGNTVSIGEAMGVLGLESESLAGGVLALEDIEKDINGNVTDLGLYIVDFDGSVKKLDASVFNMTGTVDDLDGDITDLFNNISLLDGGIDGFGTKVDELGVSTDDLGIDITNLGTTLTSAMTSLGSIVSSLSNAVSGLSASNNNLATAQQKAENASKIASITTTAAGVARQIGEIETAERGAGTPTTAQQASLDRLQEYLESHQYIDQEGEKKRMIAQTQGQIDVILSAVAPAEMSPEDSATLANLTADLEALRGQIRDLGGTPTFSSGGYHSGGMRLVGESGPELEATGPSRIYSAQQTRNMLSGGSGEVVVELRSLRREVSELKAEQRKVGVENVKYNKKSYDLYREWDTVGLPATRTV